MSDEDGAGFGAAGQLHVLPSAANVAMGHAPGLRVAPTPGFLVEVDAGGDAGALFCPEVRGFEESLRAAERGGVAPARLTLASVDVDAAPWLACWSEDEQVVERTLRVARLADGASLTVVATLAILGRGMDTALAVGRVVVEAPRGTSRLGDAPRGTSPLGDAPRETSLRGEGRAPRPPLDSGVYVTVR